MADLLPCPFCGGNSISFRSTPDMDTDGKFHCVSCNECGAKSREKFAMDACPLFYEELRNQWNTRPAAPVEGLERYDYGYIGPDGFILPNKDGQYVRFDQAEAIIAAERAETERWHKKAMGAGVIVHSDGTTSHPMRKERDDLKADNAALTARVKAQTEHIATLDSNLEAMERRAQECETQLATSRKALETIADAPAWGFPEKWETTPAEVRQLARAALEGKP